MQGAEKAFDELNGKEMAGGTMELAFEWDTLPYVESFFQPFVSSFRRLTFQFVKSISF